MKSEELNQLNEEKPKQIQMIAHQQQTFSAMMQQMNQQQAAVQQQQQQLMFAFIQSQKQQSQLSAKMVEKVHK